MQNQKDREDQRWTIVLFEVLVLGFWVVLVLGIGIVNSILKVLVLGIGIVNSLLKVLGEVLGQ